MSRIWSGGRTVLRNGGTDMKCPVCRFGDMDKGFAQVVLNRGNATVIFRNVPAMVCCDCGEYYLDEQTADEIYARADSCFSSGQEIAIMEYRHPVSALSGS